MSTDKQDSDTTIINETQNENETTALAVSNKPNERKFKIPIFKGDHTRTVSIDNKYSSCLRTNKIPTPQS